jgi:hypothetical protein
MLPILRILPVGGVLLAILILALAHEPPGASHPSLVPGVVSARGALQRTGDHPEWRQFLILAATKRADELNRLRDLPARAEQTDARKVAGLPIKRDDTDPDDDTGSINEAPTATIPVEIGETSATELPVSRAEEKPPVVKKPERAKPLTQIRQRPLTQLRQKPVRRAHRANPPVKTGAPYNFLDALFAGPRAQQPAFDSAQTADPATIRGEQH